MRNQIGVVLQDTALSGTVAEGIAYCSDASREDIEPAARTADAHEFICAFPRGYDTELGPGAGGSVTWPPSKVWSRGGTVAGAGRHRAGHP